ncbi:MAG: hypothetical protein FWC27_09450 [Firmicutes bacterium]|nr:hypothetical protein [Bacillota bacterium]
MKRLALLTLSLLLLAGCGVAEPPEAPATTVPPTIAETANEPQKPEAKPFTKDDIAAIEANFKTVGDYVKAAPAAWYRVEIWEAMGGELAVEFYDHAPNEDSEPYLSLLSRDVISGDTAYEPLVQELPNNLLDAKNAEIHRIDFAKAGGAIPPPRGIKIGDPAQKIFEAYPDYRSGDSTVLYDITAIPSRGKAGMGQVGRRRLDKY